jgi:hypothetical protein
MAKGGGASRDLRVIAAIGTVVVLAGLGMFLRLDPTRAEVVVSENGPVEWVQAALLLTGWVVTVARALRLQARGRAAVPELLLGALLTVGITVELSLHSEVGFRIRHWRPSLRRSAGPVLPWVVLSVGLICALAAAGYLVAHCRAVIRVVRTLPRSPWGQLAIAGGGAYAASQVFQHRLERLTRPRSFLWEEAIELVGALCLCLAAWQLARAPTDEGTQPKA